MRKAEFRSDGKCLVISLQQSAPVKAGRGRTWRVSLVLRGVAWHWRTTGGHYHTLGFSLPQGVLSDPTSLFILASACPAGRGGRDAAARAELAAGAVGAADPEGPIAADAARRPLRRAAAHPRSPIQSGGTQSAGFAPWHAKEILSRLRRGTPAATQPRVAAEW